MKTAKLFANGRSQAVRLPQEFRFEGESVQICRFGSAVVLLPISTGWESLFEALDEFTEDFPAERNQPADQDREPVFS